MSELGDTQEVTIELYEPRSATITIEKDDLRTLIRVCDLGLDESGIIQHIFDCINVEYPTGGV